MKHRHTYIMPSAALTAFPSIPLGEQMEMAASVGFDGIEIVTFPGTDFTKIKELAEATTSRHSRPFEVRFHEVWSLENGSNHKFNYVAAALGKIPRKTEPIESQIRLNETQGFFVGYAHRIQNEVHRARDGLLFQTCQVVDKQISIADFVRIATTCSPVTRCVVFDTMHYLEWCTGGIGVSRLARYTNSDLERMLLEGARTLLRCTQEIHLCDALPDLGDTKGRNPIPGRGKLPLKSFGDFAKQVGWTGRVTPEVQPRYAFKKPVFGLLGNGWSAENYLKEILDAARSIME